MLVGRSAGSELALHELRLERGAVLALDALGDDLLLYVYGGGGQLQLGDTARALRRGSAALLLAGERARLTAGDDGLALVGATVGADVDLHAPLGSRELVSALDEAHLANARGGRTFQVLFGPHNGSLRATLFVGYTPPAPPKEQYHLYDEIVWVSDGAGRLHRGDHVEALARGTAFRLRPRERHAIENVHSEAWLALIGVLTPAGDPSAAYVDDLRP